MVSEAGAGIDTYDMARAAGRSFVENNVSKYAEHHIRTMACEPREISFARQISLWRAPMGRSCRIFGRPIDNNEWHSSRQSGEAFRSTVAEMMSPAEQRNFCEYNRLSRVAG